VGGEEGRAGEAPRWMEVDRARDRPWVQGWLGHRAGKGWPHSTVAVRGLSTSRTK
jgi:hypothetical protein